MVRLKTWTKKKKRSNLTGMKSKGLFDEAEHLMRLIELCNPLEKIDGHINWEAFRSVLKRLLRKNVKRARAVVRRRVKTPLSQSSAPTSQQRTLLPT
jgi:hypothetical protein